VDASVHNLTVQSEFLNQEYLVTAAAGVFDVH